MSTDKILMLLIAIALDFCGLIMFILSFLGIGIPFSFVLDIIGGATVGLWSLIKGGQTKSVTRFLRFVKFGGTQIIETIPFAGDIAPSWTILVFLT